MWILRRLKALGATCDELIDVMQKQVLSVLMLGVPAWYSQLTVAEVRELNRVLRCGLRIIYGTEGGSFNDMLASANMVTISKQMEKMTHKFAVKCSNSPKFSEWFQLNDATINTRSVKSVYKPVLSRTKRYQVSPIPHLTSILNSQ